MRVSINGQHRQVADATTITELLRELDVNTVHVAVEVNRDVVPRLSHAETVLSDGDEVEIVTLVGGG